MPIKRRLPDAETLYRRRGAIAGFVTGAFGSIVLILLVTVMVRGYGITDDAPVPPQVYTNF